MLKLEYKKCKTCGKDLPLYEFYFHEGRHTPNCRTCMKKKGKIHRAKGKPSIGLGNSWRDQPNWLGGCK
jgi:hypothetical protein